MTNDEWLELERRLVECQQELASVKRAIYEQDTQRCIMRAGKAKSKITALYSVLRDMARSA